MGLEAARCRLGLALLVLACSPAAAPPTPAPPATPALDPECTPELRDARWRERDEQEEREAAELRRLQTAVEQSPNEAQLWAELGNAHGERLDEAAAVNALEQATRLAPDMAGYWRDLGRYRLHSDDRAQHEAAAAAFRTCLEKDPKLVPCQWGLGTAFELLGELPSARDALKRAMELGASCQMHLASVHLSLGEVDAADALVQAELEKERAHPSNPDGLYFYHSLSEKIAERRGDAAATAAARERVVEATPSLRPFVAFNLGSTYAVMQPPRVEPAQRLLDSFVRNTCDEPNHGEYCDECATAKDLLEMLREERGG